MKQIYYLTLIGTLMFSSFEAFGQNIEGVWQQMKVEYTSEDTSYTFDTQPGIVIITKNYYSIAFVHGSEERPMTPENTKFEDISIKVLKETLGSYTSNSGTYELKDNTITLKPTVSLWPGVMNNAVWSYGYSFEKNNLVWHYGKEKNGKRPGKVYLKRLE